MAEALVMLVNSLRSGRNSTNIQWDTMRKTRTWLNNTDDSGQEYTCKTVVRMDRAKQYITIHLREMVWSIHEGSTYDDGNDP
jgi:hypothetical protein